MTKTRRYEIDGRILDVIVRYDEQAQMYIEEYPDLIANPVWTENGHRVLFSGTDACRYAEEASPGGCPDCGSCKYYRRAGAHTWLGICQNKRISKETFCEEVQ